MSVRGCVHMSAVTIGVQKRSLAPLGLALQAVKSPVMSVGNQTPLSEQYLVLTTEPSQKPCPL